MGTGSLLGILGQKFGVLAGVTAEASNQLASHEFDPKSAQHTQPVQEVLGVLTALPSPYGLAAGFAGEAIKTAEYTLVQEDKLKATEATVVGTGKMLAATACGGAVSLTGAGIVAAGVVGAGCAKVAEIALATETGKQVVTATAELAQKVDLNASMEASVGTGAEPSAVSARIGKVEELTVNPEAKQALQNLAKIEDFGTPQNIKAARQEIKILMEKDPAAARALASVAGQTAPALAVAVRTATREHERQRQELTPEPEKFAPGAAVANHPRPQAAGRNI